MNLYSSSNCQFLEIWHEDGVTAEPEDDGHFKFELFTYHSQILEEVTKLYDIPVIRNLVHLCISLSSNMFSNPIYCPFVGPFIIRHV